MKSTFASLCLMSPVAAARYGLLRVESPVFTDNSPTTFTSNTHDILQNEDLNLVFRQLLGYADLSLSVRNDLSFSMATPYASLSMKWDSSGGWSGSSGSSSEGDSPSGQLGDNTDVSESDNSETDESTQLPTEDADPPSDVDDESSASGQAAGSSTESETKSNHASSEKGETGKKAMIGILSVAGVALVGAALARKMKQETSVATDGENSSVPSEASMEGHMENVPL